MQITKRGIAAVWLLLSGFAAAQGVGASGSITGTVADPQGAVVANAKVTATDRDRGVARTTTSGDRGKYVIADLPPARYQLSVEAAGFEKVATANSVELNVGEALVLDFHLSVAQRNEQVTVTTEPPVVEVQQAHQADVITERQIESLPINRRDYLTFTLLAPAVSDSTRLSDDQDYRVKQTPQSGLSFYGSNGRGNSVTVDGGEANDDAGGVRLTMGQEAVNEFQINRSNYSADLGSASGASINIVSKSGTNDVHGSGFGFFRNSSMDAADPFAYSQALAPGAAFNPLGADVSGTHVKDSLSRQQYGASLGGPLKKDRTFFFLSFEGLRQDAQNAVPLLTSTSIFRPQSLAFNNQKAIIGGLAAEGNGVTVPCLSNPNGTVTSLPAAVCAGALTSALTVSGATGLTAGQTASNNFLINQLENNGGLFPYNTREYLGSARLDHKFGANDQFFVRFSSGSDHESNPDVTSLTGFSRGSTVDDMDVTVQPSWFHNFGPRVTNELRGQINHYTYNVIPNAAAEAGLDIPGYANLGTQIFLPNKSSVSHYEIADNVSFQRGSHSLKFGFYELIRTNNSDSHTFFPGRFVFGTLPGVVLSPCMDPRFMYAPAALGGCGLPQSISPANVDSLQSASLGAPLFYQQGFGSSVYEFTRPFTAAYVQDSWSARPGLTLNFGLRYELDSQNPQLNTDEDNFSPRVSFAWDPANNHKTVIRGGYGIFYAPVYAQVDNVVHTLGVVNGFRQIPQVFVPLQVPAALQAALPAPYNNPGINSAAIYQTLFAQGKIQCTTPAAGQAACITPNDLAQFGFAISQTGSVPPFSVLFSGQKDYQNPYSQQAEFGIEQQLGSSVSISASYVYVHTLRLPVAIDVNALPTAPLATVTGVGGQTVSVRNWNSLPLNPLTPGSAPCGASIPAYLSCFANPGLLQNNVYSSKGSALYQGAILEIRKRFSSHFSLMANYTYSRATDTTTDFNSDYGPVDNTNLAGERALSDFDQRHKLVVAPLFESPWQNAALKGFQLAPIVRYNSPHPFNLLAGTDVNGDFHYTNDRPIGVGRNTGIGPNYLDADLRLSRTIKLGERANVQFIAESFNLTNRTNYASVNNEVGPNLALEGFTTAKLKGSAALPPTVPLGFTSAFPKRQIQLALRLGW
ncbi:MAG: TonB-dependent receptor [Acidobacteria bacterium]|nr:TonB-dependent receptor [Acidobacteriota bacterium]